MKPAQKILVSCRQTSEAAARLMDWLEVNPGLLGVSKAAVREDIDALANRLTPIARAAEAPPGIGLLATPGAGKTELLFQILATRAPTTLGELGQRPLDNATIRGLLPQESDAGGCVIVRFSAAETPPSPRGYPIRVGLLSVTDLAVILARAACSSALPAARPAPDRIAELFESVSGQLSPQAVPGLSGRDVLDLRETLYAVQPDHPALPALAAARYWEQFREIAPHITERDRRRLLAVLWQDDPTFTTLFTRLCDGLDRLGQGADAYCPSEALLGKDKASGWMTRHPRSIIHAATLATLDQPTGAVLTVMNRYGQAVEVERAVLAGLISELPLHLGTSRLNELAPAEILDFPVPPPVAGHVCASVTGQPGPATGRNTTAVGHYARAKAIYLFERACLRRDVTTLVVAANPDLEDDTFAAAIGDWVEGAQGATAHARERVRRGLFLAAALPKGARSNGDTAGRMGDLIRDVIGYGQEWPAAWTPNRPLTDVFWFSSTETNAPHPPSGTAIATLATAMPGQLPGDDQISSLVRALALAGDVRQKHLQLGQSLLETRRRLRGAALRHHASNDPAALDDWRRGTAVVVQNRLQYITSQGRLGHLQRALLAKEEDLACVIQAAAAARLDNQTEQHQSSSWPRGNAVLQQGDPSAASQPGGGASLVAHLAETAVAYWLTEIRRVARSGRLCRDLRIEPALLQNLIDELQIGALRVTLASEIASAFLRSTASPAIRPAGSPSPAALAQDDIARLAAYASRIINAYLEVLAAPGSRGRASAMRGAKSSAPDLEVAEGPLSGYSTGMARARDAARGGARRITRPSNDQWEISFVSLVDDNISAAHLLVGRGDKDRELGELIALFAAGPFEVEP
jgi:hypothetical protein